MYKCTRLFYKKLFYIYSTRTVPEHLRDQKTEKYMFDLILVQNLSAVNTQSNLIVVKSSQILQIVQNMSKHIKTR